MAGAGFKDFAAGDLGTATEIDTYLMQQSVMRFANASARTTALSGYLAEGMVSYLDDQNKIYYYDGSAWQESPNFTPWTTYTTTHNITLGTGGTIASRYSVIGKHLFVRIKVTLGSSLFTMPTNPSFTIPSGLTMAKTSGWLTGYVDAQQSASAAFKGQCQAYSGTQFYARAMNVAGTYLTLAAISSTVPFTWAAGNTLELEVITEIS